MSFELQRLSYAYGIQDITLKLPLTGLVTVLGPNGAGKSTLVSVLAGLRGGYRGACRYTGREVSEWPRRELAKRVAFLPQSIGMEFPFTAEEVVLMGRTPLNGGWFELPEDRQAAERALLITDALAFRKRDYRSLSGGERQRVLLASALAQEPETLLLDEPATHLDLKHQIELYRLLASLGRRMLVIAVTHDLNLALQFAQHAIVLERGGVVRSGEIEQVLDERLLADVFGVRARLIRSGGARPWMHYGDLTSAAETATLAAQREAIVAGRAAAPSAPGGGVV
jgi:iron complex transport system ATP-binding protein